MSGADPRPRGDAAASASTDPFVGRLVGERFLVLDLIARGGMGRVYRAEQVPLGRLCALKILNPRFEDDDDPEFQRRFYLEAATAARLSHPNTVTIFDYGRDGDVYYIAMEYIDGRTLY
ncbi:MAG: serine/threonine protein kinase, partial [Deltaproteobacteria bacterium]|nr:serine/threonine protein kinase [Deltaproteobacteria bacterium]